MNSAPRPFGRAAVRLLWLRARRVGFGGMVVWGSWVAAAQRRLFARLGRSCGAGSVLQCLPPPLKFSALFELIKLDTRES